jgi:3-hydroxybutyryl-CoA dehydrogenase
MTEVMSERVVVVGAGTMGPGIAQVFATGDNDVTLTDIKQEILDQGRQKIRTNLDTFVQHMVLTKEQADKIFSRIKYSLDNNAAAKDCDLLLEAAPEKLDLKKSIFSTFDMNSPPDAILASNTSGIPIRQITEAVKRKSNVLGIHFYNPPHLNVLVEIIRTDTTSDETVEKVRNILVHSGKKPVTIADIPGFLHNRLIYALLREAVSLVQAGETTVADVDTVVREAFGPRFSVLGLFKLVDIVGIDIYYSVSNYLNKDLSDTKEASPWVKSMTEKNELGLKSGKGFYTWTDEEKKILGTLTTRMIERMKQKS